MISDAEMIKQLLEETVSSARDVTTKEIFDGGFFDQVIVSNLSISHCAGARILCSFRIPAHLTDEEGNWHSGAIAALIDDIGACAVKAGSGDVKLSVDFSISYFSPAKINEEVEIDARVVEHKEKMTSVRVEVRKKGNGVLVALGRQWMALSLPQRSSNL